MPEKMRVSLKQGSTGMMTICSQPSNPQMRSIPSRQGITDNAFSHYDTPLTVKHETEALMEAGFSSVQVLKNWGATYTLKAVK